MSHPYSQLDQYEVNGEVYDQHEPDPVPVVAGWPDDIPRTAAPALPPPASPPAVESLPAEEDELPLPPEVVQVTGVGFLSRWLTSNPVRVWLYGVLAAAIALLVAYGLLTEQEAYLWGALGAAVLGVPTTEAVRGSVYSPRGAAAAAWEAVLADRAER